MKIIRDPINGNIRVEELELKLIDTPQFQRLRRISQLGFSVLAYPCSLHTRFDHSLGTMFMAEKMCGAVGAKKEDVKLLKASALLHDLGHPPFSHDLAGFLEKHTKVTHEDKTKERILRSDMKEILEKNGLDPKLVAELAAGESKGWRQMLITGREGAYLRSCVDADILDYMVRDSYYTGVAYGMIERDRLIDNIRIVEEKIVMQKKAMTAVEGLLLARYVMLPVVYRHHVAAIGEAMITHALEKFYQTREDIAEKIWDMDEIDFIAMMRQATGYPGKIMKMLDRREMLKRGVVVKLPRWVYDKSAKKAEPGENEIDFDTAQKLLELVKKDKIGQVEKDLERKYGVEDGMLMIDVYPEPARNPYAPPLSSIMMWDGENLDSIEHLSMIAHNIGMMDWALWDASIYCPKEKRDELRKKFAEQRIFEQIVKSY